jgi:hypothetical protein
MEFNQILELIKNMSEKDKLRLAIQINETSLTNIDYNKQEMFEKFDARLKEIDEEYSKSLTINKTILMIVSRISELSKEEQNKIVLYLFNSIK